MKFRGYFVDLFAGCGGISLGLEQAGFHPVFVNELNKDAMDTYLSNRIDSAPDLKELDFHCYDIKDMVSKRYLNRLKKELFSRYALDVAGGHLDLLVGGPPCQGYSGIGHRRSYSVAKKNLPANLLYKDMVHVIKDFQPKLFLFENVKGLLSARWTAAGTKGEIWRDILATFNSSLAKEYWIDFSLVHAHDYGVPQNRPRLLMVGLRKDISGMVGLDKTKRAGGLLPEKLVSAPPDLVDILGDLVDPSYVNGGQTLTYPVRAHHALQKYFRTNPKTGTTFHKGDVVSDHQYSMHSKNIIRKFTFMIKHNGRIPAKFQTKKFAQRILPVRWGDKKPNITAASLPDDYVHFSQARSMTVREWARLQMFPDWYQFSGKRTTGGLRRAGNPREGNFKRDLPKYTQIGNAVPVAVATQLALHFLKLLSKHKSNK